MNLLETEGQAHARATWRSLITWLRLRAPLLVLASVTVLALFVLYLFSRLDAIYSPEFTDYPFGADTPVYLYGEGGPLVHLLTSKVLSAYRILTNLLGIPMTPIITKAPYAAFGAINVVIAICAFATLNNRLSLRSIIYGACFGSTLIIWFYASVPESYSLTTLIYSTWILLFVRAAKLGLSVPLACAMAVVFLAGLFNDISVVSVLIVPLAFFGIDLVKRRDTLIAIGAHLAAIVLYAIQQLTNSAALAFYVGFFREYTAIGKSLKEIEYAYVWQEPLLSFFLFALGAPNARTTRAPWFDLPEYRGFFEPSVTGYFAAASSVAFLAIYIFILSFARVSQLGRLLVALGGFVLLRFALAWTFNPVESMLYTSVGMLAFLLILFSFLETSTFRFKTPVATAFLVVLLATNAKFMLGAGA